MDPPVAPPAVEEHPPEFAFQFGFRLDPLDPKTSHHLPQCEFVHEIDPAVLRLAPKVQDGAGGDYWWVMCGSCDASWQVAHFGERVG